MEPAFLDVPHRRILRAVLDPSEPHRYTRFFLLRLLGLVYFVAFLSFYLQHAPLVGPHGLLPASHWLDEVAFASGSRASGFFRIPSLFWILGTSDRAFAIVGAIGTALAFGVLCGITNVLVQGGL